MKTSFVTLVIREYLEYRSFLWIPAVAALLLVLLFAITGGFGTAIIVDGNVPGFTLDLDSDISEFRLAEEDPETAQFGELVVLSASAIPMLVLLLVLMVNYCLNCLYDDRRDRSFLFWQSMPVSEWQTVSSKVVTLIILAPLLLLPSLVAMHLASLGIISLGLSKAGLASFDALWQLNLPLVWLNGLLTAWLQGLWSLPLFSFLMLISAVARRSPLVLSVVVIFGILVLEALVFDDPDRWLVQALRSRLKLALIEEDLAGWSLENFGIAAATRLLGQASFWWGLLVSAGFLGAAALVRRLRGGIS